MAVNTARDLLWPKEADDILVRVVFLYVGQGSSTLVLFADGDGYGSLLLDVNLASDLGGVHVPNMLADLLDGRPLGVFANSHPHDDHLGGVELLGEKLDVAEVWDSGHKPGKGACPQFAGLEKLIEAVKKKHGAGAVTKLKGSDSPDPLGDAECCVLAPAEYVVEEIADEKPKQRDARIHEHCAVLRVGAADTWVLLPGDADRPAFEKHIAEHHRDRLGSVVMAAPHHGSKSFFLTGAKGEEPYLDALEAIGPDYVVVSAPTREESRHNHPDQEAIDIYAEETGSKDCVLHTGEKRYSFICDIRRDGTYGGVTDDKGALAEAYPADEGSGDDGKSLQKASLPTIITGTRVDDRPMGGPLA